MKKFEQEAEEILEEYATSYSQVDKERLAQKLQGPVAEVLHKVKAYLFGVIDEWLAMTDDRKYELANVQVYNHVRKELDDLEAFAEILGVNLDEGEGEKDAT